MLDSLPTESADALPFPADTRTIALRVRDLAGAGISTTRFVVANTESEVLHIRLTPQVPWLTVAPQEVALARGESQSLRVRVDVARLLHSGEPTDTAAMGAIRLLYQQIHVGRKGSETPKRGEGNVFVRLPFNNCPNCALRLDETVDGDGRVPEFCPRCFERLRACPVCGTPNSWLVRLCVADDSHVVRNAPDFPQLGGGASHRGIVDRKINTGLSRKWSFPSVPTARIEEALSWSAPAAAYGIVAAASATSGGESAVYAFDAKSGAPLWEPYPLPDPVYPERGGISFDDGKLYAATVEGIVTCLDAQRGTRIWETSLAGRVFGSVTPVNGTGKLLIAFAEPSGKGGSLAALDLETGKVRWTTALSGLPDVAPAGDSTTNKAFAHDDGGSLTCTDLTTGEIQWRVEGMGGFNAAPVLHQNRVYSATHSGIVHCFDAENGTEFWQTQATGKPLNGTPAFDGSLLYIPADDALHIVSASGKAVRRYNQRQPIRSAPLLVGGSLFFGGGDGRIYGANPGQTPDALYETGVGSRITAALAFADDLLFFVATNGCLYALGAG